MIYRTCKTCIPKPITEFGTYHRKLVNSKKLCYYIYCKECLKAKRRLKKRTPIQKIRHNISNSIRDVIKYKYGKSIFSYLEYTILDLRNHLESQFDDKMTWENYGFYWHLDHIIPHSTFKYTSMKDEEFRQCWALINLRPLEAKQNILEGIKRTRHNLKFSDLKTLHNIK